MLTKVKRREEGVRDMLTLADKGGRGWSGKCALTLADKGWGGGVSTPPFVADIIY